MNASSPENRDGTPADLYARAAALRREVRESVRQLRLLRDRIFSPASSFETRSVAGRPARFARGAKPAAPMPLPPNCPVIVIAASAGGLRPLTQIVRGLPAEFPAAVLILQHQGAGGRLGEYLKARSRLPLHDTFDGDWMRPGHVLVCPAARHVRVNANGQLSVWAGRHIGFVRPSADVAFRSLAAAFGGRGIAVVLSGCGEDGAMGSRAVHRAGGTVVAEDERSAQYAEMPVAAVDVGKVDLILTADRIPGALATLVDQIGGPPERG